MLSPLHWHFQKQPASSANFPKLASQNELRPAVGIEWQRERVLLHRVLALDTGCMKCCSTTIQWFWVTNGAPKASPPTHPSGWRTPCGFCGFNVETDALLIFGLSSKPSQRLWYHQGCSPLVLGCIKANYFTRFRWKQGRKIDVRQASRF